jgi:hypothetical protein
VMGETLLGSGPGPAALLRCRSAGGDTTHQRA